MASRATQSLATGMKIMGGANMPMYTLEFLDASGRNSRGSFMNIVVPYAVLGRDKSNAVPIGDEHGTVSRKHAAIERVGKEVRLLNLSQTNPTLVNGQSINSPYYLKNGDEIQLSLEGPKLRYNETQTGTAKMGFTNRMNLVVQQSIKPYKTAAFIAMTLVLLTTSVSGYFIYQLSLENDQLAELTKEQEKNLENVLKQNEEIEKKLDESRREAASMIGLNKKNLQELREQNKKISDSLLSQIKAQRDVVSTTTSTEATNNSTTNSEQNISFQEALEKAKNTTLYIRFVRSVVERPASQGGNIVQKEEDEDNIVCTGFLTDTGKFVTARHCFDAFLVEDKQYNLLDNNGYPVVYHFVAKSYDGKYQIEFTNKQMITDYSKDRYITEDNDLGLIDDSKGLIRVADYFNGSDWGYIQTSYRDGLKLNGSFPQNIPSGTELHIYGYSYGENLRYSSTGNLEPYYSTSKVKLSGIRNGLINTSESTTAGGNSGGPVMAMVDGELQIIGLITGGSGEVRNFGYVTPATYFAN